MPQVPIETSDKNFQTALKLASPERGKQLETIRRDATFGFYFNKCMNAYYVPDISQLAQSVTPMKDDPDFQTALELASTPEQRKQLEELPRKQYECFLEACLRKHNASNISELVR